MEKSASVLVVGSGLAGLSAALALAEKKIPVTLVTSDGLGRATSSGWAQGGIAAAMGADDSPALHAADTMAAGAGLCDAEAVRLITEAAPDAVRWLEAQGVAFDRNVDGRLKLGLEGAHGRRRIVHADGDGTGLAIVEALREKVQAKAEIRVVENVAVTRLAVDKGTIRGVWVDAHDEWERVLTEKAPTLTLPQAGRDSAGDGSQSSADITSYGAAEAGEDFIAASHVVLATGGVGGLWRETTNPLSSMGQGLALAARAGAVLRDVEFVQFHPTAIVMYSGEDFPPMPLASEALRGEGALLVNDAGKRFMDGHPQQELAPRDVVARAIWAQLQAGRQVYLDARGIEKFARKFPTIHGACRLAGINPVAQPIPVRPAAHYHMGGVKTDLDGQTSVAGLWACGEVASTGLQGANRLASNSLLEAVVMGRRVATAIAGIVDSAEVQYQAPSSHPQPFFQGEVKFDVRKIMSAFVGLMRDGEGLAKAVSELQNKAATSDMALAGLMIATAASRRKESRGAQARVDFPLPVEAQHQDIRCEFIGDTVFVVSRMTAV